MTRQLQNGLETHHWFAGQCVQELLMMIFDGIEKGKFKGLHTQSQVTGRPGAGLDLARMHGCANNV